MSTTYLGVAWGKAGFGGKPNVFIIILCNLSCSETWGTWPAAGEWLLDLSGDSLFDVSGITSVGLLYPLKDGPLNDGLEKMCPGWVAFA